MKADDLIGFVLFGAYKLQGWSQLRGRDQGKRSSGNQPLHSGGRYQIGLEASTCCIASLLVSSHCWAALMHHAGDSQRCSLFSLVGFFCVEIINITPN